MTVMEPRDQKVRQMNNLIENLLLCVAAFAFLQGIRYFVLATLLLKEPKEDWENE
jgi:hypothetical protein